MNNRANNILRCPECYSHDLVRLESSFQCTNCKSEFIDFKNVTTLIAKRHQKSSYDLDIPINWKKDYLKLEAPWDDYFKSLIPKGQGLLLDYACGGGKKSFIESLGYDYIGLDYFLNSGVDILAHGMNIPIQDNSIDLVTSQSVMEHIPNPWDGFREISRILKPGGLYVGATAFLQPYHANSYFHMSHLGVRYIAENTGFEIVEILPSKMNGIESITNTMYNIKYLKKIVSSILNIPFYTGKYLRKLIAGILIAKSKDDNFKKNMKDFMQEEDIRYSAVIYYILKKI
ncbi:MAG: class I SAM-dependent methyltransferase [Ignavibacteriae bacterium]|nr:class I SAM-dependent methyltransferase [Ignavibacteriota bacterium]